MKLADNHPHQERLSPQILMIFSLFPREGGHFQCQDLPAVYFCGYFSEKMPDNFKIRRGVNPCLEKVKKKSSEFAGTCFPQSNKLPLPTSPSKNQPDRLWHKPNERSGKTKLAIARLSSHHTDLSMGQFLPGIRKDARRFLFSRIKKRGLQKNCKKCQRRRENV